MKCSWVFVVQRHTVLLLMPGILREFAMKVDCTDYNPSLDFTEARNVAN